MEDQPKRLLSTDDVAVELQISRKSVLTLIHTGFLRARKRSRTWQVPRAALEEYLSDDGAVFHGPGAQPGPTVQRAGT